MPLMSLRRRARASPAAPAPHDKPAGTMVHVTATYADATSTFQYDEAEYDTLVAIVRELFRLHEATDLVVKYRDDEGDLITIGSSAELHDATLLYPQNLHLRVFLRDADQQAVEDAVVLPRVQSKAAEALEDAAEAPHEHGASSAASAGNTTATAVTKGRLVRPASDFQVIANELHYHRLIIQTAITDFFQRLRPAQGDTPDVRATVHDGLRGLGQQFSSLPSPQEIGQFVANKFAEMHAFAAPVVEAIRSRVIQALELFFNAINNRRVTYNEVEAVTHQGVDQALQEVAAAGSADFGSPSTATPSSSASETVPDVAGESATGLKLTDAALAPTTEADAASIASHVTGDFDIVTRSEMIAAQPPAPLEPTPVQPAAEPTPAPTSEVADSARTLVTRSEPSVAAEDDFVMVDEADTVVAADASNPHALQFSEERVPVPLIDSLIMPTLAASAPQFALSEETVVRTSRWSTQIGQLRAMGFTHDAAKLHEALEKANGNIAVATDALTGAI